MKYKIKQLIAGTTLETVEADSKAEAYEEFARIRGFGSWSDMVEKHPNMPLNIYAEKA